MIFSEAFFDELEKISQTQPIKHVFITGVPGSGKTTQAHRLERRTGIPVLHGDDLRASFGNKYPGTDELRLAMRNLKAPHIIEGVQVMGLKPKEVAGHDVKIISPTRKTIVGRLVRRGWEPTVGGQRHDEEGAGKLYDEMSQNLSAFKERIRGES